MKIRTSLCFPRRCSLYDACFRSRTAPPSSADSSEVVPYHPSIHTVIVVHSFTPSSTLTSKFITWHLYCHAVLCPHLSVLVDKNSPPPPMHCAYTVHFLHLDFCILSTLLSAAQKFCFAGCATYAECLSELVGAARPARAPLLVSQTSLDVFRASIGVQPTSF